MEDRKRKEIEREAEGQMRSFNRFDRPRARVNTILTPRYEEYRSRPIPPKTPHYPYYTPLTTSRDQILMQIKGYPELKWPVPLTSPLNLRNPMKYCKFHKDHGHDTSECFQLKNQIEELIQNGKLGRYVQNTHVVMITKPEGTRGYPNRVH